MVSGEKRTANGFVRAMRAIYNAIGFRYGYNFALWFLADGYIFAFALSRLYYLAYDSVFCNLDSPGGTGAAPGECYYWTMQPFEIGMKLHLYTIIPASLLVTLQFVPAIRHRLILVHRLNGYLVVLLSLISSAGAIIIAKHAFGGDFATQTFVGMLAILTTGGYVLAWVNVKLLQIDQHRAWMMRTWAWFATIITLRIIMVISAQIISTAGDWYTTRPCAQIEYALGRSRTLQYYPECAAYLDGSEPNIPAIVTAHFGGENAMETSAALGIPFGTAGWLALVLHTIAMEVYLRLTPIESERLRQLSYEKQLARGMKRPGYSGLVPERIGHANPFVPTREGLETPKESASDGDDALKANVEAGKMV